MQARWVPSSVKGCGAKLPSTPAGPGAPERMSRGSPVVIVSCLHAVAIGLAHQRNVAELGVEA